MKNHIIAICILTIFIVGCNGSRPSYIRSTPVNLGEIDIKVSTYDGSKGLMMEVSGWPIGSYQVPDTALFIYKVNELGAPAGKAMSTTRGQAFQFGALGMIVYDLYSGNLNADEREDIQAKVGTNVGLQAFRFEPIVSEVLERQYRDKYIALNPSESNRPVLSLDGLVRIEEDPSGLAEMEVQITARLYSNKRWSNLEWKDTFRSRNPNRLPLSGKDGWLSGDGSLLLEHVEDTAGYAVAQVFNRLYPKTGR